MRLDKCFHKAHFISIEKMMLSASAARIGRVSSIITRKELLEQRYRLTRSTALFSRHLSDSSSSSSHKYVAPPSVSDSTSSKKNLLEDVSRRALSTSTLNEKRHQSSVRVASLIDEQDDQYVEYFPRSPSKAITHATPVPKTHFEDWMVNLGRGRNKEWLTGPRPKEWFTGLNPENCPGVDRYGIIRSLSLPNLSAVTRRSAREYFENSWTLFETLFAGLKGDEPFYRPPVHGLRHPQIFYYGHTACLYINKLRVSGVLSKPVNAYFESIFEVGVDEMLWDDMHKNDMVWPTVSEVHEYRKKVHQTVVEAITNHPSLDDSSGPVRVDQNHPMWALFMGFEHERIHLETSSVLFRETPIHLVQAPKNFPNLHPSAKRRTRSYHPAPGKDYPLNGLITVSNGSTDMEITLGKPPAFPSYGWDNEYGTRTLSVPTFAASQFKISNGEFYEFVADGAGYRNREYWCDDGWAWRAHRNMKWPFFWEQNGPAGSHQYKLRTIFEVIDMQWDWPVDVNYYEAKAFCNWKSKKDFGQDSSRSYRILTEAEHHAIRPLDHNLDAARLHVEADRVMSNDGQQFPSGNNGANLNLAFSSQSPVNYYPPSHTGHHDVTGNVWEWTEDHFNPLKGFEAHHFYDDFSSPCFDGKHCMIVGGSFISTGDEASVFARFHFRPHFLQHSGFRLVLSAYAAPATHLNDGNFAGQVARRDATKKTSDSDTDGSDGSNKANVYETKKLLDQYLGLHFPFSGITASPSSPSGLSPIISHKNAPMHGLCFPQRVANMVQTLQPIRTSHRALDIGCAVGGSSFELAKHFDSVDAFDYSAQFVAAANEMKNHPETVRFHVPIEADIQVEVAAALDDGVTSEVRNKVNFFTGDACLLEKYAVDGTLSRNKYDGVLLSNLLCRLPDPVSCLNGLSQLVNDGGVVVMVTPFSWLEEFTPRSQWLGGYYDPVTKKPIYSKDKLRELMEERGFEKIHEEEVPLIIREHQRKYQYIVSELSGWRKRSSSS